ncbi:sensor histidine kinase [Paenibacillus hamazuiensis]|uniref:sensor histidine kinase n=1 Tax=Paenibacillus hamazuiensis TaxID=2936508 RepID=UPI00200F89A8|nr:histidine kinase [Paenibacillus hamazuiensis]
MTKTIHRFFIKHLTMFLIPTLIPTILLGMLAFVIIQGYVKEEINHSNMNMLKQSKENVELIFNELDSLGLYFMVNAIEFASLKRLILKPALDLDDYKSLATLKNFIDAPATARPYIDSIYVYLTNKDNRFITTVTGGLQDLDHFYDTQWYDSYRRHNNGVLWVETRSIRKYQFNTVTELISVYKKLSATGEGDGVIVLNIDAKYVRAQLSNLAMMDDQSLLILDRSGAVIMKDKNLPYIDSLDLRHVAEMPSSTFELTSGKQTFIVSKLESDKYGWTFLSVSPRESFYSIPIKLIMYSLLLLLLSFLLGTAVTYYLTRRNYLDLKMIVGILDSAEHGKPLPALPSKVSDVYSYIVQNLLKRFIEYNYLSMQLSERKYRAQAMELMALQSQLNPHFLFNTLETINWRVLKLSGMPNEVNGMIEHLGDILRYSLDDPNKKVILQKEILHTERYIDIQKIRYEDTFDVIWEYEDHLQTYNVIKMILQPLVENSLYHGIKEAERKGLIKIKIRLDAGGILHIAVIDNGIGMDRRKLQLLREDMDRETEQAEHIGLYNTHKRLKLTYGETYGVTARSKAGWGTAVYLRIPVLD